MDLSAPEPLQVSSSMWHQAVSYSALITSGAQTGKQHMDEIHSNVVLKKIYVTLHLYIERKLLTIRHLLRVACLGCHLRYCVKYLKSLRVVDKRRMVEVTGELLKVLNLS